MPLRNRVTPFSALEAVPDRGTLMGNRGILHDAEKRISTSTTWRHKKWLACALSFKDRRRKLMVPGEYTALFFLDEATSLAAGHRPCWECRRADYGRFLAAWRRAGGMDAERRVGADEIDAALHLSRVTPDRRQARFRWDVGHLADGAFLSEPDEPEIAWLMWKGALHRWSHGGYVETRSLRPDSEADVITPLRIIEALRAGYVPKVHPSAA